MRLFFCVSIAAPFGKMGLSYYCICRAKKACRCAVPVMKYPPTFYLSARYNICKQTTARRQTGGNALTQPPSLDKALSGDRAALEELAAFCWPVLFGYLRRLCGNRELAQDLVQDAMVRALEALDGYRPRAGAGFMSWAFRIARNRFIDYARRSGRDAPLPQAGAGEGSPGPDTTALAAMALEDGAELRKAIMRLSPDDRELLELRYWFGFSHREAAQIIGIKPALVKSRLNAALGRLRKQYEMSEKEHGNAAAKAQAK
jgi:RNA polymerase sigma-70 factor, ECF subfamily